MGTKTNGKPSTKEIRRARVERGVYAFCETPLGRGTYICDSCMDKRNTSSVRWNAKGRRKAQYHANAALGICTRCPAEAVPDQRLCGRCAEEAVEVQDRVKGRRVKRGTCVACDRPPVRGRKRCEHHLEYQKGFAAKRRRGRKLGGVILRTAA